MKLIKTKRGYVNADAIEELAIVDTMKSTVNGNVYEIVAYAPNYSTGFPEKYVLAEKCTMRAAQIRIDILAEWLTKGRDGIFNAMNIRITESDNE